MYKTISIIGGDLRQLTLAELLVREGFFVNVYGFGNDYVSKKYKLVESIEEALKSDVIILPMPVSSDLKTVNAPFTKEKISLSYISECKKSAKLVLGGRVNKTISDVFYPIKVVDYYQREELMIKNAVPTAEGAIEIAIEETPRTIKNSKTLVVGYGRIGKVMAKMLKDMGSDVSVSARKYSDLAWIEVNGYTPVSNKNIKDVADNFDIIFNTAPALILDEEILKKVKKECVIIDLASKPGGVDFEKAKDLGLNVIWALSLPGKVAPITSGEIIKETVMNILGEEGV